MKKYVFIALAAIAALSSCNKENSVSIEENGTEVQVFNATIEDCVTTKATFDETNNRASWETGDVISIDGHEYTAEQAGASSTFTGSGATGTPYHAYFPAGLYNGGTPTLPSEQNYADGKFNMPMYAESSSLDLSFKNLCGVLKITVTNAQLASVKCITVSSTNCATSGPFTVSGDAAVLADASNTANTVTVTYTDAVTTDATGKVFYVAIPAQTYKNLSIAVSDGETTKVMTTNKDQDIVVDRNTIYPITFVGSLTTGIAQRTSKTSNIDVKWIQLWKDGPKFAEYNVGAANKAEDYGGYYCWGSATDKDASGAYNTGTDALTGDDDTATNLWGENWRMPTQAEFDALLANCTVEWTTVGGMNGCKFTGKGAYASNSVFLPAAGFCRLGNVSGQGDSGGYWSSAPDGSDYAYFLLFNSGDRGVGNDNRYYGYSVRAVLAE